MTEIPDEDVPLSPEESLDDDELGDIDAGYSPVERPLGSNAWGTTEREQAEREDLTHRLAREVPDQSADDDGDGIGDTDDTDGEPIDDEVGDERAGRLVAPDEGLREDDEAKAVADDVGIDGAAAGAEEAAVHVIDEDEQGL
jgi:hypothetical protein